MAERLVKQEYSGQKQLYNVAMVYIECDGEKSEGLKILKTLASSEYMPAMARLINLNAASPQMTKRYKILQCRSQIYDQIYSRKLKISSIARTWTLGGAKYGSGGMGRAGTEAEIWSDIERSKLAAWKNNEMKRCDSAKARSNSSFQTLPPPFYEIGKPSNSSQSSNTNSKRGRQNRDFGDVFHSGSSINSKGETMCQYENGTNINNGYDSICPMSISDRF